MNIQGKLIEKYETQVVSDKFRKREFVIEYTENLNYPEFIKFELVQDKVTLLDPFNIGDVIDVSFNLRGRAWINPQGIKSYFNSLQAWRLNPVNTNTANTAGMSSTTTQGYTQPATAPVSDFNAVSNEEDSDLPF
jgi:hypothetical protein